MVKKKVTVKNATGLGLKPAEQLCKAAMKFKSHTGFEYGGDTANIKSILSVLGSGVKSGEEITLFCSGDDEKEALEALIKAVEEGLGE